MNVRALLAGALLGASLYAYAADPTPARSLLILSKQDRVLEIRDPDAFTLLARVPVGPDPHEIAVSADGRHAYVSNTGGGDAHRIDVIDIAAAAPLAVIDTAPLMGPHGLAWRDGKLWFTAQGSKAIGRWDLASGRIDSIIGTGQDTTHLLHLSRDGATLFASNTGSGTISVLENTLVPPRVPPTGVLPPGRGARMDWVHTLVAAGEGAEGFDVSPDERRLWTVLPGGEIAVIDTASRQVVTRIRTGFEGGHRVAFTRDGRHVFVAGVKTGALGIYDAATGRKVKQLDTCRGAGLYMDEDGKRAFVSCTPDNEVTVVDTASFRQTGSIRVGRPDGIAIATRR